MEVIRSIGEFEALHDEWNRLADRHENPLLWHEWLVSCARTLHAERDLFVVVDSADGRLMAAAPLVVCRAGGVTRLEFLGVARLFEPCGFLYDTEEALARLVGAVSSHGYAVALARLGADDAIARALRRVGRRNLVVTRKAGSSLAIELRGNWQSFRASLPAKLRYDLSRAKRRAESVGEVRVDTASPAPTDVGSLLEDFGRLEASGWKGRSGSALQHRHSLRSFFFEVARGTAVRGALRVARLWMGEDLAAAQLAIAAYNRIWVLKIAFNERLARCSPGLILTGEAVRHGLEQGFAAYEFLGVAEPWEKRWNPNARDYVSALIYPYTVRGFWALALDLSGAAVRRAARALRPRQPERSGSARLVVE